MSIRDAGTTIRQSSTALLTIDSEDRFPNWTAKRNAQPGDVNFSPYNFSLIRNAALVNGYMTRLAVTEVVFPWTYPNINNKTNKILCDIAIDGVVYQFNQIELPLQFMNPRQLAISLANAVQSIINSAPISRPDVIFGCAYGSGELPRFDYYMPPGTGIAFYPVPAPSTIYNYPYPDTTKQLFDVLGFTVQNRIMLIQDVGITVYPRFGQTTFAQAVRYIDIVSPTLTANQGLIDSTSQSVGHTALCRLYLGDVVPSVQTVTAGDINFSPPGTQPLTIYRQFSFPKQISWNAIMPVSGSIQFQVYDDNGELLEPVQVGVQVIPNPEDPTDFLFRPTALSAYNDWSMTLLLSEN